VQEEFENGFGSHTPMYSGQTKCVRYYMNFERALGLAKECLQEVGGQQYLFLSLWCLWCKDNRGFMCAVRPYRK
jgi:hypothetical protein